MSLRANSWTSICLRACFCASYVCLRADGWHEQLHCAYFQPSAAKWMKTALLWVITQRIMIIYCGCFGTVYRSRPFDETDGFFPKLQLEITTTRCLKTPRERSSHFLCCNVRAYIYISTCSGINILSLFTFSLRHPSRVYYFAGSWLFILEHVLKPCFVFIW